MRAFESLDQVDAAARLQRQIDDGNIRLGGGDALECFGNIGRLAAHFQVWLSGDSNRECLAHDRVIIDDEDPGRPVTCPGLTLTHGALACCGYR
jgi:hypothetical protein